MSTADVPARPCSDQALDKLERAAEDQPGYGTMHSTAKLDTQTSEERDRDRLIPEGERQSAALDMTRIMCVFLVSVDHGGTAFGVWNTMYVQAWVLQYLFLICGICFGMSNRSIWGYCQRLCLYFVIGVCCNWTAFIVAGLDWKNNMWNVVFQFWFIVGLMGFCLILAPLRQHLRTVVARRDLGMHPLPFSLMATAAGAITVTLTCRYLVAPLVQKVFATPLTLWATSLGEAAVFWDLPQTVVEANVFIARFVGYFELTLVNIFLAVAWPVLSQKHGLCGWLMILNTYTHKVFLYRAQEARLLTGFDCTTIGLAVYFLGLAHRKVVGRYFVRYWFIMLFLFALLWPPGQVGRFDEHPPHELGPRLRDNLLEMIFMIMFLCGMELIVDPAIFTVDKMQFLGYWALIVFLVHKAVHITTPPPFNWIIIVGLVPLCWLAFGEKKAASEPGV